jgi:TonB family protein
MGPPLKHEPHRKQRVHSVALFLLGCLLVLVVLPAQSAQVGSTTAPIWVSTKEADENLEVKTLHPEYPSEAKAKGIEGTVRLRVVIDERGNVVATKVVSGSPLLVPPAIALVKQFPYRPFTRGGKRVAVTTDIDVPFELHPIDTYGDWKAHRDAARQMCKDGRMETALEELQKALADARKLGDTEVADTYSDLADFYNGDGRYEDASHALEERLQTLKRSQVQDETEVATTESDLARVCIEKGELDKGKELLKRSIPVQEKFLN